MTKEDLNNKHTFKRYERLKNKKTIASLFTKGSYFVCNPLIVRYSFEKTEEKSCVKAAFVVPKKKFKKAVDRNKIKRKITAAFRQNKYQIYQHFSSEKFILNILFIYNTNVALPYESIENAVKKFNAHLFKKTNFNTN
ncbi:MAG: ribonuclease P protein component [Bacteroidetes bacterium]|nr:ribonuclease P protein component [Bacteroidota bacterium]MCB9226037.1 ribonuclease P protein component [Chitinophagales bacterium]